jgi:hypothetical protein
MQWRCYGLDILWVTVLSSTGSHQTGSGIRPASQPYAGVFRGHRVPTVSIRCAGLSAVKGDRGPAHI